MADTKDTINRRIIFRFLGLSKKAAADLKQAIPAVDFGVHYKTKKIVGSIPILDSSLIMEIDLFRRAHLIKQTECDIFVSIASTKNDETWQTPKTVNYLVNVVGCPIVFSFTSGDPDASTIKKSVQKKRERARK